MHPQLFGKHVRDIPMMQASMFASAQERGLVALVRALLPLPDVLLINNCLGNLADEQGALPAAKGFASRCLFSSLWRLSAQAIGKLRGGERQERCHPSQDAS